MNEEDNKLTFIPSHRPALEVGTYKLTATLDIPQDQERKIPADIKKTLTAQFTVQGERFALKPGDVQAVFPPAGSLGDHSNVLPHIILNRSTLPWERDPRAGQPAGESPAPWLALLLFDEQERLELNVITLEELRRTVTPVQFPKIDLEAGQDEKERVTAIDVPVELLKSILSASSELPYLAHVRQRNGAQGNGLQEFAVVIGNRLPKPGSTSIVHLVSLEGRFKADGSFDYGDAAKVRLVSLYSWRFACQNDQEDFKNLLLNLECKTMRLPRLEKANDDAEKYLKMGCVPLRHTFRRGEAGISWYHGPLLPGENQTKEGNRPAGSTRCADELVRFDPSLGLFDVSYAAAWELGRLIALQNKTFSTDLFIWKRMVAESNQRAIQVKTRNFVTSRAFGTEPAPLQLPSTLQAWFRDAANLVGIPLYYLVPDERLLPPESIRFFFLDWLWLNYLLNGAFSIGRVSEEEQHKSVDLLDSFLNGEHLNGPSRRITGFLLRSEVVGGWPGLQVDGHLESENASPSTPLRMDRLTNNILICLFEGNIKAVDIHLKPETLHFGVSKPDRDTNWYKTLRDNDGAASSNTIDIPFKEEQKNVISVDKLAEGIKKSLTSAEFAFQMIEGVEKVQLVID
jgi:hypothetical protein